MLARAALLFAFLPAATAAATWTLDPDSRVTVSVPWHGSTVTVRFPAPTGDIDFDPAHPERTRAALSVAANKASTGLPPVDVLVRSRDYLDTAEHPQITFTLDKLVQTSKQTATVTGEMTMRGVTQPLTLQASVIRYGPADDDPAKFAAGFDLTATVDRTTFGSTGGLPDVPAELGVQIRLLMELQ